MFVTVIEILFLVLWHISAIAATVHVLLTKRNSQSCVAWILCFYIFPIIGVIFYLLFGINRISGVIRQWESVGAHKVDEARAELHDVDEHPYHEAVLGKRVFEAIQETASKTCTHPLYSGCLAEPLFNGTEAYPMMIDAIHKAKKSVYLMTYLFGTKGAGAEFIDALYKAHKRGVEVKVLIDGIGGLYSWPTAYRKLRQKGVPVAAFLKPLSKWQYALHLNLRNHRKICVIDGELGFTGGMNINEENMSRDGKLPEVQDVHFKITGPAVCALQEVFVKDWYFATGEPPAKTIYYDNRPKGDAMIQSCVPSPSKRYVKMVWILMAAFNNAEKHIRIMTPYLVLNQSLTAALIAAALRGVRVDVVLPEENNLKVVKAACESMLPIFVKHGVNVYYAPDGFKHSKLVVIDDYCTIMGSANLDNRSLYLNFEFNMIVYCHSLAHKMIQYIDKSRDIARPITLKWLNSRSIGLKLRDAFFRLFAPYL